MSVLPSRILLLITVDHQADGIFMILIDTLSVVEARHTSIVKNTEPVPKQYGDLDPGT